jgi:hypothetical protein
MAVFEPEKERLYPKLDIERDRRGDAFRVTPLVYSLLFIGAFA